MKTTVELYSGIRLFALRTFTFLLLLLFSTNGIFATCPNTTAMFTSFSDHTIGSGSFSMQTGDVNNDGKKDLILADKSNNAVKLSRGNGDGTFQTQQSFSVGTNPLAIAIADFDADNDLDFVTANQGANTISVGIWSAGGGGSFSVTSYSTNEVGHNAIPASVTIGHFDNNSSFDIVTGNNNGFSVFDNSGGGAFTKRPNIQTIGLNGVAAADFDLDGLDDVIGTRGAINTGDPVYVFFNNGGNPWTSYQTPISATEIGEYVITGDFDNDGNVDDAVTTGHNHNGSYHVVTGNGNRTMTLVTQVSSGPSNYFGGGVKAGDFNADSKMDIALASGFDAQGGSSNLGFVYLNQGGGAMVLDSTLNTGSSRVPFDPAAGDFNSDGKIDLAFATDITVAPVTLNTYNLNATYKTDYDGDGRSDYVVWRPGSSPSVWYEHISYFDTDTYGYLGVTGDIPVPGDYDGDKKTDVAVFRPSNSTWYVIPSGGAGGYSYAWGTTGDKLVPGDYDGDGKTDFAVFRPSDQTWYITKSSNGGYIFQSFGNSTDIPIPGDYGGDGKWDITVYRPSDNKWYILPSTGASFFSYTWGTSGDKLVPGDYDGDCITDVAVYRPSDTTWYARKSSNGGTIAVTYGVANDVPQQGDFDGDGRTDYAFWNSSSGDWHIKKSSTLAAITFDWGQSGDVPAASIYPQ